MHSGNDPASQLVLQGMRIRPSEKRNQPDQRSVTDLIALAVCPRNAHFFSEGRYPINTPSAVKGRLLHRTIKNLHDHYQVARQQGRIDWIPDGAAALEEYRVVENAAKVQGYPPLPLKQSEQLQQMLHTFHAIEARQFYPHIRSAEVPLSWLWEKAPGRPVLLEGKVDVVFTRNKSGIALWDYKTTKQPQKGSHEYQTYRRQMKLYTFLYRQCYKETPQETALYFMQELAGQTPPTERPLKALYQVPVDDDEDILDWLYDVLTKELEREEKNQWNPPPPEEVPPQVCHNCGIRLSCPSFKAPFPWDSGAEPDDSLEPFEL
jgi:PD-(D/E)XK nuclease superfamily